MGNAISEQKTPASMKALHLVKFVSELTRNVDDYKGCFQVYEVPTPTPREGEVLIRMERSPINPMDLSTFMGTYDASKRSALPSRLGHEGSGVVVGSGGGILANRLVGKRVAIFAKGAWAEYVTTKALNCLVIEDDTSFEEASSPFVNPITCISFLEIAREHEQRFILHYPGNSVLGRMLIRLGKAEGFQVIALVRKEEQVKQLKDLGAYAVFNTTDAEWKKNLRETLKKVECRIAFDALAGPMTGQVLALMPDYSRIFVYGGLSMQAVGDIRASDLIFSQKVVQGYHAERYMRTKSLLGMKNMSDMVSRHLKGALSTQLRSTIALDQIAQGIVDYVGDMSAGKILFNPTLALSSPAPPLDGEHTTVIHTISPKKSLEAKNPMFDHKLGKEVQVAIEAVRKACQVCNSVQKDLVQKKASGQGQEGKSEITKVKEDSSPVTVADFAAQILVTLDLLKHDSKTKIVGEEDAKDIKGDGKAAELRAKVLEHVRTIAKDATDESIIAALEHGTAPGGAQGLCWALDPIDGTKGFLRCEQYAVALGLIEDGKVVMGVLGCPNLPVRWADRDNKDAPNGVIFVGIKGVGSFMIPLQPAHAEAVPIRVSNITDAKKAFYVESVEAGHSDQEDSAKISKALGMQGESSIRMDSQAKYGVLARGDAPVYLRLPTRKGYVEKIWDHAAGVAIIEAAGGKVTDVNGVELDFSQGRGLKKNVGVIATNGHLHEEVIAAVKSVLSSKQQS